MYLNLKYRIYPTKGQISFLTAQLRDACDLYNAAIQERKDAWKTCRKSIQFKDQSRQLPPMRAEGCLSIVNSQCAQNVLRRVDKAFKGFFARIKRGEKAGLPRYRSFQRYDSLTYPQYPSGCRLLDNGKLYVQGAGHIKIKAHRPIIGKIKTATLKRESNRWFVLFSVQCDPVALPRNELSIGIDVGLTTFATLSSGIEVANPRYYRKAEAKLRRCQRRASRRKRGSRRHRKSVILLQRTHIHIRNQRADFQHKASRNIVNGYGLIAVEQLNLVGLCSSKLSKSVSDAGWGSFIRMLSYKAESAGRIFVKVASKGTSQTCLCGARVAKTLDDRHHDCNSCGLSGTRDHISAQVILQRARIGRSSANVEVLNSCVA